MNKLCLAVFVLGLMVVVSAKTLQENIKVLRTIDLDVLLKNDRIIRTYIDCVVKNKRCTKEGNALKDSWKEGLDKACEECSEEEQRKIKKIVKHIYVNKREWYDELANALDKDMKYRTKYDKYIKEILDDTTL